MQTLMDRVGIAAGADITDKADVTEVADITEKAHTNGGAGTTARRAGGHCRRADNTDRLTLQTG